MARSIAVAMEVSVDYPPHARFAASSILHSRLGTGATDNSDRSLSQTLAALTNGPGDENLLSSLETRSVFLYPAAPAHYAADVAVDSE